MDEPRATKDAAAVGSETSCAAISSLSRVTIPHPSGCNQCSTCTNPKRLRGVSLSLPISLLDLCSYLGLGAVGAASINLLLGMLISLRYSPLQRWPHRRISLFALHQ